MLSNKKYIASKDKSQVLVRVSPEIKKKLEYTSVDQNLSVSKLVEKWIEEKLSSKKNH